MTPDEIDVYGMEAPMTAAFWAAKAQKFAALAVARGKRLGAMNGPAFHTELEQISWLIGLAVTCRRHQRAAVFVVLFAVTACAGAPMRPDDAAAVGVAVGETVLQFMLWR